MRKYDALEFSTLFYLDIKKISFEKIYHCSQCLSVFSQNGALKKHLRIHSGEKPYPCNQCLKAFSQSESFKNHLRIHSGEKPYPCNQCPKTFSESGSLKKHLRIYPKSFEEILKNTLG